MDNKSIGLQQDMDRVRSTYDAVAVRYAEAMVQELDERPIERGLLDEVVRGAREGDGRLSRDLCNFFTLAPALQTESRTD